MFNALIKAKLKASSLHLLISALVIGCFTVFILKVWYPDPFFSISGLSGILLLIVAIDLVLGPLLTFVVYQPKKRTLLFDLSAIAAIQLGALFYGAFIVYEAHPLYVAFAGDRFTPINANEVDPANAKFDSLKKSKLSGPTLVYVKKPSDPDEMARVTTEVLSGKPDLDARPEYYNPLQPNIGEVLKNALNPTVLQENPNNQKKLQAFIAEYGQSLQDYAFIPLVGRAKDVLWVFDVKTGEPVDTIDIDPWQNG